MSEFFREVKGILSALCILEDGERFPAKYQEVQALEIKRRYLSGEGSVALASEFGLHRKAIWLIGTGKKWKHLPDMPDKRGLTIAPKEQGRLTDAK